MTTSNNSTPKRPRGRPAHAPTAASRMKVSIAAGSGTMTHQEIAIALGISRETLDKWYGHELSIGALSRRMEVMQGLFKKAKAGNSSAARVFLEHQPKLAVPPPGVGDGVAPVVQPAPGAYVAAAPQTPKPLPVGKKEQANADAKTVQIGTDWDGLLPSSQPLQ